ncbi:MAG: DUF5016 domain-containing protein [Prevotella sp.]|jgi:hypothetical protein|nr:DUF5016 domain-containing protein [Prevotella sp.]MCI1780945.1 DUF5016 domain-containing protein [Prevotella sp.]MCI1803309.1 DUF5016 domain-containing protein [Prevotella sp.]MCI1816493.1 DUF5016 domain-containing protein [Prevotella sp.]MCI1848792.1 DUF5016 domain-containing protein [Prevotella sp.]
MKKFKYLLFTLLALSLLGSCSDDDNNKAGNPVIDLKSDLSSACFGDSLEYTVNCKDEGGVPLSTLKAFLYFSDELVSQTTIRTKTEGDYTGKIYIPYLKGIPNGKITLKLVLQNIRFSTTQQDVDIQVSRPENDFINLVSSDGQIYKMLPVAGQPYQYSTTVPPKGNETTFSGHFVAPAFGEKGVEQTFGERDNDVIQGETKDLIFSVNHTKDIQVTFNTQTYAYAPVYDPKVPIIIDITQNSNVYVGNLIQGHKYRFTGDDAINAQDWFYDTDYFKKNRDSTFTFQAVSGSYTINADFSNKYFRIWSMNGGLPTSLNADGSGALWIIGSEGINKPFWNTINHGWWTGTDSDLSLAQIKNKVYQLTLTVGQQLDPGNVNFKFFGQPGWGTEFHAKGGDYVLSLSSSDFFMGDGTNGGDNGNVYPMKGVTLKEGDTYVFTVDLTKGCAKGVVTVTKK